MPRVDLAQENPVKDLYPDTIHRILVRGTNWVGDAVMSVPALKEVRRIFPRAHIALLVRPWVKDVYSAAAFVDEVLEYDKQRTHKGWTGLRRIADDMRRRTFDLAILLQNAFEAALIPWWAGIPRRLGYARDGRRMLLTHPCRIDPEVGMVHQVYYYLGILAAAGLLPPRLWQDGSCKPSISSGVRREDRAAAKVLLREEGVEPGEKIVGVNPGAFYGPAKRWLSDRYAAAADRLAEKYRVRIVIFGAANERQVAEEVARQMKRPAIILAGRTSLGTLMGLIKECSLLVTNDSGPMHLAAALDVPQVAIFGSSSEIATGPLGPEARVIKHPVGCSPCFLRECPIDFRCMTRITVDEVLAAAHQTLSRK